MVTRLTGFVGVLAIAFSLAVGCGGDEGPVGACFLNLQE
jgi:hypothetical protein